MSAITTAPSTVTPQAKTHAVSYWPAVFVFGIVLLGHAPLLAWHFQILWAKPHYQFLPLVPIGVALLAFRRLREKPLVSSGSKWGLIALALSVGVLSVAVFFHSPWFAAISLVIALAGLVLAAGGWPLLNTLLPAWLFCWLIIPLPLGLDESLVHGLQQWTAKWSSQMLDLLGVIHVMAGNVVEIPGRRLLVEEACSGIHSLFAILTCTWFYVLWARPGLLRSAFLLVVGIGWVLAMNAARVLLVSYTAAEFGWNLSEGWTHTIIGWCLFAVILGMIWCSDRLWLFVTKARVFAWLESRRTRRTLKTPEQGGVCPLSLPPFKPLVPALWVLIAVFGCLGTVKY